MQVLLAKTLAGHLAPINEEEAEQLKKLKIGHIVEAKIVRKRNSDYHRRFFALIGVGFDAWQEVAPLVEYKGVRVLPSHARFREDVQVMAGHYDPVFDLNGGLHLRPRSISFAAMDQDEFETLFSRVLDVLLSKVLAAQGYTEETLRETVQRILDFDH